MFGQVRGFDGKPIFMIKVSVYSNLRLINKHYTDDEGKYSVEVPEGELISIKFDTHSTLNNAHDWHPSVVANLIYREGVSQDRYLLGTQQGLTEVAAVDALCAYLFIARWNVADPEDDGWAQNAASRLTQLRLRSGVLHEVQRKLQDYFHEQAE